MKLWFPIHLIAHVNALEQSAFLSASRDFRASARQNMEVVQRNSVSAECKPCAKSYQFETLVSGLRAATPSSLNVGYTNVLDMSDNVRKLRHVGVKGDN